MTKHLDRVLLASVVSLLAVSVVMAEAARPNIVLMTVDDMNFDSIGVYGCPVEGTTPNLDQLATQGVLFNHAHITVAVCQPSRAVMATGMYPHHSGVEGFYHLRDPEVRTIQELLSEAGYLTGVVGKLPHSDQRPSFKWDLKTNGTAGGRSPKEYRDLTQQFVQRAQEEGRPFYLNINSSDPHRPFHGSDQEKPWFKRAMKKYGGNKHWVEEPSKVYKPSDITVPAFLPDIKEVRREVAEYYSSVRRADDCVGAILKALSETGVEGETLVIFLSDHGMAFPFAKSNCYLQSTKTPWMMRWPGEIKAGLVNSDMISAIDILPTALDAAGVPVPGKVDGQSLLALLKGEPQTGRDLVFTQFHELINRKGYPMRAVQNKRYGYLFSPWTDGKAVFRNESCSGRTFKAMEAAAKTDPEIAARVDLFKRRVLEEFYDFEKDPSALNNLIDNPEYAVEVNKLRTALRAWMVESDDKLIKAFDRRHDRDARLQVIAERDKRAKSKGAARGH